MGCRLVSSRTANRDMKRMAPDQRRKLLRQVESLAEESPELLDGDTVRADSGQVFRKCRRGRHRVYMLGGSEECTFGLHTVAVNKDAKLDPSSPRLQSKLGREFKQAAVPDT